MLNTPLNTQQIKIPVIDYKIRNTQKIGAVRFCHVENKKHNGFPLFDLANLFAPEWFLSVMSICSRHTKVDLLWNIATPDSPQSLTKIIVNCCILDTLLLQKYPVLTVCRSTASNIQIQNQFSPSVWVNTSQQFQQFCINLLFPTEHRSAPWQSQL